MRPRAFVPTAILAATASSTAFALPDFKATSQTLKNISHEAAANPALSGTTILKDSDSDVIYVSPATRKVQAGVFSPTADVDNCEPLQSLYAMTYLVPSAPVEQWPDIAKKGPFSPFFDMNFGNEVRYAALADRLVAATQAEVLFQQSHAVEYSEYIRTKDLFDAKKSVVDTLQSKFDGLDARIDRAMKLLEVASTAEEMTSAREALRIAKQERAERFPEFKVTYRKALDELEGARGPFAAADGTWAPYKDKSLDLTKARQNIEDTLAFVNAMSTNAFMASQANLTREENRLVGIAAVTFSLFEKEVDAVRSLPSARNMMVNPLSVYDVSLGGSIEKNSVKSTAVLGANSPNGAPTTFDFTTVDYGRAAGASETRTTGFPTFANLSGQPFFKTIQAPVSGPQTIRSPVSRGAYCTGTRKRQSDPHTVSGNGGATKFNGFRYVARTSPLFADSVGLRYKYAVKAEPVNVNCTLKFNLNSDFTRNAGKVTGLFYSRQWDDTTRNAVANNGITCDVANLVPPGPDSDSRKALIDELTQKYSQEVAAEFILTYGKSWAVATVDSAPIPYSEREKALSKMGTAMLALCGPNLYCQISGLVLKTLDEIFGTTSGNTTRHDEFKVAITRDYRWNGWTEVGGQAAIDLEVKAPR